MKWKPVDPKKRVQPKHGTCSMWKKQIADDCGQQCVYCAISEARNGGLDNFHVDHFRPKSMRKFAHLENNIQNLFLSCAPCNRFKHDDWPGEPKPNHSVPAYPDPSKHDYNDLLTVSPSLHTVQGRYVASRYVVERLYLNRPQLIRERRLAKLEADLIKYQTVAERLMAQFQASHSDSPALRKLHMELTSCLLEALKQYLSVCRSRPYMPDEIRRQ